MSYDPVAQKLNQAMSETGHPPLHGLHGEHIEVAVALFKDFCFGDPGCPGKLCLSTPFADRGLEASQDLCAAFTKRGYNIFSPNTASYLDLLYTLDDGFWEDRPHLIPFKGSWEDLIQQNNAWVLMYVGAMITCSVLIAGVHGDGRIGNGQAFELNMCEKLGKNIVEVRYVMKGEDYTIEMPSNLSSLPQAERSTRFQLDMRAAAGARTSRQGFVYCFIVLSDARGFEYDKFSLGAKPGRQMDTFISVPNRLLAHGELRIELDFNLGTSNQRVRTTNQRGQFRMDRSGSVMIIQAV